jgi:hypothetical protein
MAPNFMRILRSLTVALAAFVSLTIVHRVSADNEIIGRTLDEMKAHYGPYTSRASTNYGYEVYDFSLSNQIITCVLDEAGTIRTVDFTKPNRYTFNQLEAMQWLSKIRDLSQWDNSGSVEAGIQTTTDPRLLAQVSGDKTVFRVSVKSALASDQRTYYRTQALNLSSDLSGTSKDDLTQIAQLAAQEYHKLHSSKVSDSRNLAMKIGLQPNLTGDELFAFRVAWQETFDALNE